ncbi:unnamed protein product, partial [Ectocarpus sp. 8 AP-2014]
ERLFPGLRRRSRCLCFQLRPSSCGPCSCCERRGQSRRRRNTDRGHQLVGTRRSNTVRAKNGFRRKKSRFLRAQDWPGAGSGKTRRRGPHFSTAARRWFVPRLPNTKHPACSMHSQLLSLWHKRPDENHSRHQGERKLYIVD